MTAFVRPKPTQKIVFFFHTCFHRNPVGEKSEKGSDHRIFEAKTGSDPWDERIFTYIYHKNQLFM